MIKLIDAKEKSFAKFQYPFIIKKSFSKLGNYSQRLNTKNPTSNIILNGK